MKKLCALALTLALLLALAACGLFSSSSAVKLGNYTHSDPKDLTYDQRIVLENDDFGAYLEDYENSGAYPDTMVYDESGSMIGFYDYDEETGLASGWTSLTDGSYTAFAAGEEVDLGKPDPTAMVSIPGTVSLYFVVYGSKDTANAAFMYLFLSDASAKQTVSDAMEGLYGITMQEESDTVLTYVQDAGYIAAEFADLESYGQAVEVKDAAAYATVLKQNYNVREDSASNPYKPYEGHSDPTDIDFDEKVVLTGSGEAAVDEQYAKDITCMTDILYGKDGDMVAHYTYFECPSKEAADDLATYFTEASRISDTVLQFSYTGQELQDMLSVYMGYNVLKDSSVKEYIRMIEETYYSVICK